MAHAGSTTWHEIQHRLQHRGASPDAIEILILEGIAAIMTVQDDINSFAGQVTQAATTIATVATDLTAEIQALQTQIANGQAPDLSGLVTAGASLQTAVGQLQTLDVPQAVPPAQPVTTPAPPADATPPVDATPAPPADTSTPPADGSTATSSDTTTA